MKNKLQQKLQATFLALTLVLGVSAAALPTAGVALGASAVVLTTAGCSINIPADGAVVAQAALNIADQLRAGNPGLADKLATAANTLKAATANWTVGTLTDDINTAATAVETILAVIPVTAAFAPLVSIAVAALDIILAHVAPTPQTLAVLGDTGNPYHRAAHKYNLSRSVRHPTWNGAFKSAFNKKAKELKLNSALLS